MLLREDHHDGERLDFILECQTPTGWKHIDGFFQANAGSPDRWGAHFSDSALNDYVDLGFWVVDIDTDYNLVVFAEPNQNAFWVWSSQASVPDERLESLLLDALDRGDLSEDEFKRLRYRDQE